MTKMKVKREGGASRRPSLKGSKSSTSTRSLNSRNVIEEQEEYEAENGQDEGGTDDREPDQMDQDDPDHMDIKPHIDGLVDENEEEGEEEGDGERLFGNQHRIFTNFMLAKKIISKRDAKALYEKVTSDQDKNFTAFLKTINKGFDLLYMQLRLGFLEYESECGEEYIVLCNTMGNDDLSTLCSIYNPNEIAYFKMIIGLIMESDPCTDFYTASSTSILNAATTASTLSEAATTFSSFKKTDAEIALGKFVDDHWLYRTRRGRFGLGIRTIKELDFYLKELFPDSICNCKICSEPIFSSFDFCSDFDCATRIHKHCSARLSKNGKAIPKCPTCSSVGGATWNVTESVVAEKSKGRVSLSEVKTSRPSNRLSQSQKRKPLNDDDHDEEENEDQDNQEPPTSTQGTGLRKQRAKRRTSRGSSSRNMISSDEEDAMIDELIEEESL